MDNGIINGNKEKTQITKDAQDLNGLNSKFLSVDFKETVAQLVKGNRGLIPVLGRSAGEGIGYPLQYSWASLVAQLVKNLPAVWETWVRSLGWEDPLVKGKAACFCILAWRIQPVQSMGSQRVRQS